MNHKTMCPLCMTEQTVTRRTGLFRQHNAKGGKLCKGSKKTPLEAAEKSGLLLVK